MILSVGNYILPETDMFSNHSDKDMKLDRKTYIGGSDSEAFGTKIVGEPYLWSTPFIVWFKKKLYHLSIENGGFSDASIIAMNNGTASEARLRDNAHKYLQNTYYEGFEVFKSTATYRMKKYPFIGANIDGIVKDKDGVISGLEIKTTSYKKAWLENKYSGVPFGYFCQVQHYMMVLSLPRFYIICEYKEKDYYSGEIIGTGIMVRTVESDPVFQGKLLEIYKDFWENNIIKDVPPELGGIKKEEIYYPYLPKNYLTKDISQVKKIEEYVENQETMKRLKTINERLKGEIIEIIEGKEGCFLLGEYKIKFQKSLTRRFLKDRFKKDYPALHKEYTYVGAGSKLLKISKSSRRLKND